MKILIATDGSTHSEQAANKACEIIKTADNAVVRIISVVEHIMPIGAEQIFLTNDLSMHVAAEARKAAETAIEDLKNTINDNLGFGDYKVESEIISGSPREAIVEDAEKWGADLIVVGSHGYGFWDRMLLGSVSDAVIHHAPCSVLVVRTKPE